MGYSCRLLSTDTMETYVVDACDAESVRSQLVSARDHLCSLLMTGQLACELTELAPWMKHVMAAAGVGQSQQIVDIDLRSSCALVINGHSLVRMFFCVCVNRMLLC